MDYSGALKISLSPTLLHPLFQIPCLISCECSAVSDTVFYGFNDSIHLSPGSVIHYLTAIRVNGTSFVPVHFTQYQGTVQVTFSTNTTVGFFETYNVLAYTSNHEKDDAMIVAS